jgi:hypothetical protein
MLFGELLMEIKLALDKTQLRKHSQIGTEFASLRLNSLQGLALSIFQ